MGEGHEEESALNLGNRSGHPMPITTVFIKTAKCAMLHVLLIISCVLALRKIPQLLLAHSQSGDNVLSFHKSMIIYE